MPDKRTHRGPHPNDAKLFCPANIADLRQALEDHSLLLTKGYAQKSSLKLVGDKFELTERQRLAIMRSACSDRQLTSRKKKMLEPSRLKQENIVIDGYNLLITIEAAMASGVIFKGRDGCFRDLASIHGTYRKVTETIPAIELTGKFLREIHAGKTLWLLDRPVSNSGRLKKLIEQLAHENKWQWKIELLNSPDARLIKSDLTVVSSDSVILDGCQQWANLARNLIEKHVPDAYIVDLEKM